jgi:hypothetical protein
MPLRRECQESAGAVVLLKGMFELSVLDYTVPFCKSEWLSLERTGELQSALMGSSLHLDLREPSVRLKGSFEICALGYFSPCC